MSPKKGDPDDMRWIAIIGYRVDSPRQYRRRFGSHYWARVASILLLLPGPSGGRNGY